MFGKGKDNSISITDTIKKLDEFAIASFYLGISTLPCLIHSPLREDNHPSFYLYYKDNKVFFKDFAKGDSGDIITLLSKLWGLNIHDTVIKIINIDKSSNIIIKKYGKKNVYKKSNIKLECKTRLWKKHDIEYWEQFGISLKWLKYVEVYPICNILLYKDNKKIILTADKYAYAYVEHKEGNCTLKIYQPYNTKGYKWTNKHDNSVISLWTKVPEYADNVCICSSLKDALCLWINSGIPSIAIQGEGYAISETAKKELLRRFKQVFICLDNDDVGLKNAEKLAEKTGFTNIVLPPFEGGKDISDLFKSVGKNEFNKIIKTQFKI